MSNRLFVGVASALFLVQASMGAYAATVSSHASSSHDNLGDRRAGDYYTDVTNNDVRDCTMLDSEFHQAARGPHAAVPADATALHKEGVKLCRGGADEAGALKQAQAIHDTGAMPRFY